MEIPPTTPIEPQAQGTVIKADLGGFQLINMDTREKAPIPRRNTVFKVPLKVRSLNPYERDFVYQKGEYIITNSEWIRTQPKLDLRNSTLVFFTDAKLEQLKQIMPGIPEPDARLPIIDAIDDDNEYGNGYAISNI